MHLQRRLHAHRSKTDTTRLDPYYGYGYRPDWPSILSIAHDENDGGKLFVITDRPCVVIGTQLPLLIDGGFGVVDAVGVLPVKFHLTMSGAPVRGATWQWLANAPCQLTDAITHHAPNGGMGTCADFPGPYTPPPPATVVGAVASGGSCLLTFDQPVLLHAPELPVDDAMLFDGVAPIGVQQSGINALVLTLSNVVAPGSTWQITRQPAWVSSIIANPQDGVFDL